MNGHGGHGGGGAVGESGWIVEPATVAILLVLAVGYWVLVEFAGRRGTPVRSTRLGWWYAGVVLIGLALTSPLAVAAGSSIAAHMVQHEVLVMVAPLLLVLGWDAALVPALGRVPGRLAHPVVAALLWSAVSIAWHVPGVMAALMRMPGGHALGGVVLLAVGTLLWATVLRRRTATDAASPWSRIAALGLVMAAGGVIGAALIAAPEVLYPVALNGEPWAAWLTPIVDQRLAGVVMMAVDMPLELGALLWIVAAWARSSSSSPSSASVVAPSRPLTL